MRVPRTFVFVDLSGFTAYTEQEGDDAAAAMLTVFRSITRWVSSRRGVRVDKWLGDGAMLVGIEAMESLATAVEIAWRASHACAPLGLRVGVARGRPLLFEGDDYIGHSVNLAARLCDLAEANEVLCTAEAAAEAPPWIDVTPARPRQPKGSAAPLDLVDLSLADPGPHPVTDPVCGLRLAPDAVVVTRVGDHGEVGFCSASCAAEWDGAAAARAPDRV